MYCSKVVIVLNWDVCLRWQTKLETERPTQDVPGTPRTPQHPFLRCRKSRSSLYRKTFSAGKPSTPYSNSNEGKGTVQLLMERTPWHSYGVSLAIWDHSVTCHPTQVNTPRLNCSQIGRYSIDLPRRDGRLSWSRWLVTYRDGSPARKRSPVQAGLLTSPSTVSINYVDRSKRANHYTTPPLGVV